MENTKILVVDDDINICELLRLYLEKEGYSVTIANDGISAVEMFGSSNPDIILLDIMLPGQDGWQVCREIRKTSNVPIIMLTAKGETFDKVLGLELGADDYVTKPFEMNELLARITVALRKGGSGSNADVMRFADITLDMQSHAVTANSQQVKLTRTEYAILKLLMLKSEQVVAKHAILDSISFDTPDCTEDSLKIHIHNLRRKLKAVSGKDYISAVWGIGFMLTDKESNE